VPKSTNKTGCITVLKSVQGQSTEKKIKFSTYENQNH